MGINRGIYHGVGIRASEGQQLVGTVTMRPTVNPSSSAFVIKDGAPPLTAQVANLLEIHDYGLGAPIFSLDKKGNTTVFGDSMAAGTLPFTSFTQLTIEGAKNPPALLSASSGTRIYFASLAPTIGNYPGLNGAVNDWFWQFTGTTSTTHMYRCSVAGNPGTWVGFA